MEGQGGARGGSWEKGGIGREGAGSRAEDGACNVSTDLSNWENVELEDRVRALRMNPVLSNTFTADWSSSSSPSSSPESLAQDGGAMATAGGAAASGGGGVGGESGLCSPSCSQSAASLHIGSAVRSSVRSSASMKGGVVLGAGRGEASSQLESVVMASILGRRKEGSGAVPAGEAGGTPAIVEDAPNDLSSGTEVRTSESETCIGGAGVAEDIGSGMVRDEQVDSFLKEALQNPRDRLTILRLEQEVEKFVRLGKGGSHHHRQPPPQLEFPVMTSSYLRLAAHRVAQHYLLQTTAVETPDGSKIIARRTPETHVPAIRLADIPDSSHGESTLNVVLPGMSRVALLQRPQRGRGDNSGSGFSASGHGNPIKSVEERKEDYNRARARIFSNGVLSRSSGEGSEAGSDEGSSVVSTAGGENVTAGTGDSGSPTNVVPVVSPAHGSPVKSPPPANGDAVGNGATATILKKGGGGGAGGGGGTVDLSGGGGAVGVGGGGGGCGGSRGRQNRVAIFRDREKDKKDPDYDRSLDRYAQRFEPGFGMPTASFSMQPIYAPVVNYNTEFPQLGQAVARPPPHRPPPQPAVHVETSPHMSHQHIRGPWTDSLGSLGAPYRGQPTAPVMGMYGPGPGSIAPQHPSMAMYMSSLPPQQPPPPPPSASGASMQFHCPPVPPPGMFLHDNRFQAPVSQHEAAFLQPRRR